MFSGIIEEVGTIAAASGKEIRISAQRVLEDLRPGDSIAVNGACLTATAVDRGALAVEVMPETLRRSNLGGIARGQGVNLERALRLGGRVGGHLVQGHVDATGRMVSLTPEGNATLARISAPGEVLRYLVEKAFIAVDGVSLTVVRLDGQSFTVSVVGYTLQNTTLGQRRPSDEVNLEVDVLAKYIEKVGRGGGSLSMDFLAEHGFSSAR